MSIINRKRIACLTAGITLVCGVGILSACDLEMVKEDGYAEGRYEANADFSQIEIDSEGGLELKVSYGTELSVTYTESEQDKLTFSIENDKLIVMQRKTAALIGYKPKSLNIVVPTENLISVLDVEVDGGVDCSLAGEYGAVKFDVDGALELSLNGSADSLTASCNGAVNIKGKSFFADVVLLDCDGALDFEIGCNNLLRVDCDGVCNGVYYGNPTVEKELTAVGDIKKGE